MAASETRIDGYGRRDVISRFGMAYFADRIGEMWDRQTLPNRARRIRIGDELMRFIAAADDRIDDVGLSLAERQARLQSGQTHLLEGGCDCQRCHPLDTWATRIHDRYVRPHAHLGDVFRVMTTAAGVQLVSDDLTEQDRAAYDIGSTSMQAFVCAGELVAGRDAPDAVRRANDYLGASAYYYDLAFELPRDIREGARTYGTVLTDHRGAAAAKRTMIAQGDQCRDEAMTLLERRQRRLIRPIMRALRLQYRLKGVIV